LTRRANQRHSFIIAQSVKRAWSRNGALFGVIWAKIPTHDRSCIGSRSCNGSPPAAVGRREAAANARVKQRVTKRMSELTAQLVTKFHRYDIYKLTKICI
jgi:hypothetical protein